MGNGGAGMRSPYCIGVWKKSLSDATRFVTDHYLGDNVIQFVPDPGVNGSYWVMLRVTGDQAQAIQETPGTKVI